MAMGGEEMGQPSQLLDCAFVPRTPFGANLRIANPLGDEISTSTDSALYVNLAGSTNIAVGTPTCCS
jgi:hypothetical protein